MRKFIITEEVLQNIGVALSEATHVKFSFSMVSQLLQTIQQLPEHKEAEAVKEVESPSIQC